MALETKGMVCCCELDSLHCLASSFYLLDNFYFSYSIINSLVSLYIYSLNYFSKPMAYSLMYHQICGTSERLNSFPSQTANKLFSQTSKPELSYSKTNMVSTVQKYQNSKVICGYSISTQGSKPTPTMNHLVRNTEYLEKLLL